LLRVRSFPSFFLRSVFVLKDCFFVINRNDANLPLSPSFSYSRVFRFPRRARNTIVATVRWTPTEFTSESASRRRAFHGNSYLPGGTSDWPRRDVCHRFVCFVAAVGSAPFVLSSGKRTTSGYRRSYSFGFSLSGPCIRFHKPSFRSLCNTKSDKENHYVLVQ